MRTSVRPSLSLYIHRKTCKNRLPTNPEEVTNHGYMVASKLRAKLKLWHGGVKTKRQALDRQAVLLSGQVNLDAHDVANLGLVNSLVRKRATPTEQCSED
ncbi:hypothetical protein F5X97DRAFT_219858 [Nemania serpens]|nr:hypothetical protein F5X97DRAFT_219858 [Nemania serpens]